MVAGLLSLQAEHVDRMGQLYTKLKGTEPFFTCHCLEPMAP